MLVRFVVTWFSCIWIWKSLWFDLNTHCK